MSILSLSATVLLFAVALSNSVSLNGNTVADAELSAALSNGVPVPLNGNTVPDVELSNAVDEVNSSDTDGDFLLNPFSWVTQKVCSGFAWVSSGVARLVAILGSVFIF